MSEIEIKIQESLKWLNSLTDEERLAHFDKQRKSWIESEFSWLASKYKFVNGVKVYESYEDYCNG